MKSQTLRQKKYSISTLAFAVSAALASSYVNGEEQSKTDEIEVISVVGIKQNLTKAVAAKRYSSQFVDVISADEMGKLPDANVAESLQRVSGVQLERGIGEGSSVSIRGLRENIILINGRQVTGGGGRGDVGPDTLNSSTYGLLSLVPSSLVSSIEVSKQSSSSEIEGALGGVVNIITHKPLNTEGQKLIASVGSSYGELSGDLGGEYSALFSNTFLDNTLGFQVAISQSKREFQEDGLNTYSGYDQVAGWEGTEYTGHLLFRDMRFWQINDERDKTGVNAMLQWKPNEDMEFYLDSFYSEVESDRHRNWVGFYNCCGYENAVISPENVILSATVNRPMQGNTELADATAGFLSNAIGGSVFLGNWLYSGEISYTESENTINQDFIRFQMTQGTETHWDITAPEVPSLDFQADALLSKEDLALTILFDNAFTQDTTDLAFKFDAERSIDSAFFSKISYGGRYNTFETENSGYYRDIRPNFNLADIEASDVGNISRLYDNNDFFSGDAPSTTTKYLIANEANWHGCETLSSLYNDDQQSACEATSAPDREYRNTEEISAVYVQADFESELIDRNISGNLGVRYVNRDLTARGNIINNVDNSVEPYETKVNHSEVLPSAVIKMDWNDELVFRLGAARVLSFPKTEDLTSGVVLGDNNTGRGGNPLLDPIIADQVDFSTEWYFDEASLFSVGLFYKNMKSFIISAEEYRDIPGIENPVQVQTKKNGESGKIKGIELLYQQPFTFLPSFLKNTGVMTSYTYIDSQTPFVDDSGNNIQLPGLSNNNINFVLYYENDVFGTRLAYNWRDEYIDSLGVGDNGIYVKSYDDLVATANWKINDNFTLNFEALNLLDTRQQQYHAYEYAVRRNVEFGRTYKLTLSANF
ncbi:TonB-dependent receptor [Thalassotalea sp. PLHSN55]|uniref:TonB-dependent receptor n=1 Tax=Thalassotalea sp. PLHSN55 TaxID=3435888 RepID=UPI003F82D835